MNVNRMRLRWAATILFVGSLSFAATPPNDRISLSQAMRLAQGNLPAIREAAWKSDEQLGWLARAKSETLPHLAVESSGVFTEVYTKWKLYAGGRISAVQELAKLNRTSAEHEKNDMMERVRIQVVQSYYDLLLQRSLMKQAEEHSKMYQDMANYTRNAFKLKAIGKDEWLVAEVEIRRQEALARSLASNIKIASSSLSTYLGVNAQPEFLTEPFEVVTTESVSLDALVQATLHRNNNLKSLRLNADEVRSNEEIDASRDRPEVTAILGYGFTPHFSQNVLTPIYYGKGFNGGVLLSIPIFSGFSESARKRIYTGQANRAQESARQAELDLTLEVNSRFSRLTQAGQDLKFLNEATKISRENLSLIKNGYRSRASHLSDWIHVVRGVFELESSRLQSVRDYLVNRKVLKELSGI